jgi:hypothetical protein
MVTRERNALADHRIEAEQRVKDDSIKGDMGGDSRAPKSGRD